ncbi:MULTISPECIES: hypothetical protein [Alphaproteobacteria]|uniref:Class I SAM-dependent methyltransferase n=2 Tax=Alphaproteobacteria TaxID=28211 RepID=A0A512HNX2_9HYPH|nr:MULTISPECIES: hypothetical protein [Alphaproteobacteria]GEO87153.1 hypothetical protein RNA01_40850 [Ciceribacter naphthalenivorans]GLR23267.1 hypothetical protein GCM10007920_30560 [Ciceribacter naphthalenivorans]GLT06123.1 hypothetical protein GCM10007926_30560 [Sphingomonas psychrolutea]
MRVRVPVFLRITAAAATVGALEAEAAGKAMEPDRQMNAIRRYPIIGAVIIQMIAALVVIALKTVLAGMIDARTFFWGALAVQGLVAAALTRALGLPVWWAWIGLLFPVAVYLALAAGSLPAWPFGVAFVVAYLFFSNTAGERVPLYLTNRTTAKALLTLMRERGATRFIDLGSGLGGVVRALDGDGRVALGVETAPMAWLVSVLLSRIKRRGTILRQDIWSADISHQDVVYAFLSPEPMPELYEKARREMKPGGLFVSNSFAVPGVTADEVWELDDSRKTKLFIYKVNGSQSRPAD